MIMSTASATQLGQAYISNVTSVSDCVQSTVNNAPTGPQFWDIQSGGTYTVTLTGVECDQGLDPTIGVIVHNSTGGNIYVVATQTGEQGVYTFTVTLASQCLTMPIEYCTQKNGVIGNYPGSGKFAQDDPAGAAGGHVGHLRTATFDSNCNRTGDDTVCQGVTCNPSTITVCKFYDKNANGSQDSGEPGLPNWPFCLTSATDPDFVPRTGTTGTGGCTTFSNLGPGTYIVTEGSGDGTWTVSTNVSEITIDHCGQTSNVAFGNYCTSPSGGLTLGFWSNKNGNKLITSDGATTGTGKNLLQSVVDLLNGCQLRNANGGVHTFFVTNGYADFRSWLLNANATNMAYMLSAQLAALKLDVKFGFVDGTAFDLCSNMTVNGLIASACDSLGSDGYTLSGNVDRIAQEMMKTCADKINNGGPVIPVTPCSATFSTFTCH
jgi:uncharacterized protein (DUF2141 family)